MQMHWSSSLHTHFEHADVDSTLPPICLWLRREAVDWFESPSTAGLHRVLPGWMPADQR